MLGLMLAVACAQCSTSPVVLGDSSVADPSRVALVSADRDEPVVLSGMDGQRLSLGQVSVPGTFAEHAYAIAPGPHVLWLKSQPWASPFLLVPQRIRCYTLAVELAAGRRYVLREDADAKTVFLIAGDSKQPEASGEMIDNPWGLLRDCRWP